MSLYARKEALATHMHRTLRTSPHHAFTLTEILIVVLILAILAMITVPQWSDTSEEAREAALATDLQTARRQIQLYRSQHNGRGPELNENGAKDPANFVARMTGRTDQNGKLNPAGKYGPYLNAWPSNPFVEGDAASKIQFHSNVAPPRHGLTGWYYSLTTGMLYANSTRGGEAFDPPG